MNTRVKVTAFCDSLCEPKGKRGPGPMDVGYWARLEDGTVLFAQHEVISDRDGRPLTGTCNQAEYYGLLRLHGQVVKWAEEKKIPLANIELHINSDSQLMVRQINGEWKIRHPDIKVIYHRAVQMKDKLNFILHKLDREDNGLADSLAQSRVLKGSSVTGQFQDKYYSVRRHTPCAEFIRGKSPYALLKSNLPAIKKRLLGHLTDRADWITIEADVHAFKEEFAALKGRIHPINAKVDEWIRGTFASLEADLNEFSIFLAARDRDGLTDAVTSYFTNLARPLWTEAAGELAEADADKLSTVKDEFLCGYKMNQKAKQVHQTIEEVDAMEDRRHSIYEEGGPANDTDRGFFENCGVDADDREMLVDGRFEE